MAAGRYSFTIEQGSTIQFEIRYRDGANLPVDLSGYGARMHVRNTVEASTILLTLSSSLQPDGTGLNMSGSNGTTPVQSGSIGLYISAATSSNLSFDRAVYDLEIHTGGTVYRLLQGDVRLSKEVTR